MLLVGCVVGWAGNQVFGSTSSEGVPASNAPATATVQQGEVGSTLNVAVRAQWEEEQVILGLAEGIVTSVDIVPGATVSTGSRLFSVDLRPTVVGRGSIPSHRSLARGDEGPAVEQLQNFLAELGHLRATPDGSFGSTTEAAVRAWQRDLGIAVDGTVLPSDIVWVPELPAQVRLAPGVALGVRASAGEPAVIVLADEPSFAAVISSAQAVLALPGTSVVITGTAGSQVDGVVVEHRSSAEEPNSVDAIIEIDPTQCGAVCEDVAIDAVSYLNGLVSTVPAKRGLTVPTAAIRTDVDGSSFVRRVDGSRVEVTVVQSARGVSLVEGLDEGARIQIPGTADS